ncbi:MAG: apolipoprotein N-acyltransferase [Bacteroidetes bacterium]|nr:apolipoprotein N-acyltransferase [Bacteroidota bacterium]
MLKKPHNLLLALFSGLLLSLAWFSPFTGFIFIALVPLLIIEDRFASSPEMKRRKLKLTGLSYLVFFIWNLCVTWWVYFASLGGACLAIIVNALLMCGVFMIFHNIRLRINKPWTIWLLIPVWLAWEFGHTLWDLSWTWLTLGNVFAFQHNWVQWYEYTGVSGGSLWVLTVNILLFRLIKNETLRLTKISLPLAVVALPIILSYGIKGLADINITLPKKPVNIVIVQPNVDPYNEKFFVEPEIQLNNLLKLIDGKVDSQTDYLVLPETFLTENIWENELNESLSIRFLRENILRKFPQLRIITGASTMRLFKPGEVVSSTARKFTDANAYYDFFNTALQLDTSQVIGIYHKSKLVPGVERMPFPALLKPLEKLAIDMGGTMGSLGTQEERTVFFNTDKSHGIAPVVCYESVYGDYVSEYVRNGANLIFIITNDGWWEDTPGYKQHLAYGTLRAIETRCPIARSANTGISCFIDQFGDISQPTAWWEPAVIKGSLVPAHEKTLFVKVGDLISRISVIIALLAAIFSQYLRFKKR